MRLSTERRNLCPRLVSFPPRPKTKVQDHIDTELEASEPDFFHLLVYSPIKICEVVDRGIIAIKARHPFIMRKADRRDTALKLPSESGLAHTKVAMNQMSSRHKPAFSLGKFEMALPPFACRLGLWGDVVGIERGFENKNIAPEKTALSIAAMLSLVGAMIW